MDSLIRERNGKEEIWYSEEYIRRQIRNAYKAGIHQGIRVKFYAVEPMDEEAVESLVSEFKRRLNEEYQKAYGNSEIGRMTNVALI